jgi:hypothetical protein
MKLIKNYYLKDVNKRPFFKSHFGYNLNIFSFSNNRYSFAFGLPGEGL